jgi:putative ABC transport system permease protein
MIGYYIQLALKSFSRNPALTALMVVAIGLGISVCVMTLTVYHAMSDNPIAHKSDRLYSVTIDSWAAERPANKERPQLPPTQLTYRDATYLASSDIPARKVIMYPAAGVVTGGSIQSQPLRIHVRVTTSDFFPMFEVPFQYGSGWNANGDAAPEQVIVLDHDFNQRMFGGENSVGRTVEWNNRSFRIIGVLAHWHPKPLFYDLNGGNFNDPEQAYIPWGWSTAMELRSSGNTRCWKFEEINPFTALLGTECTWVQMWVELPDAVARDRMQAFVDAYWAQQHKTGRFERPRNNRLTNVGQWLADQQVVQNDNRVLVQLAFAFLGVCLLNTIGLLLAKFQTASASTGVRRALGATRRHIFMQHLVEVGTLSFAGALLGIALSALGLWGVRALYAAAAQDGGGGYSELAHFDVTSVAWAVVLAIVATLVAGVYPAWRVGQLSAVSCLKSE